jgi:uncharacterized protein DUF4132
MTNLNVAQNPSPPRNAGERVRQWRDVLLSPETAWIVREFLNRAANWWHPSVHVHENGKPIGRWKRAKQYIGTLRKLAALNAEARTRLSEGIRDAFLGALEECRGLLRRERDPLNIGPSWRRLLDCTPEQRAELAVYAYARFRTITDCPAYSSFDWRGVYAANQVFTTLARASLPFSQTQLAKLLALMTDRQNRNFNHTGDGPEKAILRALERGRRVEDLSPQVKTYVADIIAGQKQLAQENPYYEISKERRAYRERFEALLRDTEKPFTLPPSPWSRRVYDDIAGAPAARQERLQALLEFASKGKGAQPTRAWLKAVEPLRHGSDNAAIARTLCDWVADLDPERLVALGNPHMNAGAGQALGNPEWLMIRLHEDLARRLLWIAALLDGDAIAPRLEKFAGERVFFSAAITALSVLEAKAVPALVNLRRKVKGADRATVEKVIAAIAGRQGVPVASLEEDAVPDHGLDASGELELPAASGKARLSPGEGTSVSLVWIGAAGKPQKSPPKAADDTGKQQITAAKARAQGIADTLKAQAWRLECLYLTDHHWSFDGWRRTYLQHPLLAHVARRLIWSVRTEDDIRLAMPQGDRLLDADGRTFAVSADAEVRLWHPIHSAVEVVQAWRRRVSKLAITQPVKQAWREIYVLTDAERHTETYSNRFAAHILRQSQFRALGKARGWKVPAQGQWDSQGLLPRRLIPVSDLTAEFVVSAAVNVDAVEQFSLPPIATDRLRFLNSFGDFIPLDEVPPLILSEIFRDVDLFTSVASIGTDPAWLGGGDNPPFAGYWARAASGELSGSAATRREVLAELLPMLSIADKCSLDDRHLVVRGKMQTYRIHLGSGNIMMAANSQYLCIVPAAAAADNGRVRLPFEGDGLLSIIVSKAFMLTDDDKIADQTIVRQIKGRS